MASRKRLRSNIDQGVPHDLIVDILGKLPIKSLLRFKCVSKQWFSSITDPDFIHQHHLSNQKDNHPTILVTAATCFNGHGSMSSLFIGLMAVNRIALSNSTAIPRRHSWISGLPPNNSYDLLYSCDGILCFRGGLNIFVCNPATREYRSLPLQGSLFCEYQQLGFGRDLVTKRFKVVRVFNPLRSPNPFTGQTFIPDYCEIFTLVPNPQAGWKQIGNLSHKIDVSTQSVYGGLYWFTDEILHPNKSEVIVVFDLHIESFRAVAHPSCCAGRPRRSMQLGSLRGRLCLAQQEPNAQLSIWIMGRNRQQNNSSNWEKHCWMNLLGCDHLELGVKFTFAEHKNGTTLVCCANKVYVLTREGEFGYLSHEYGQCRLAPYTQSLFPVYGATWPHYSEVFLKGL